MAKRLSIQRILVLTAFVLSFFALSAQTTTSDYRYNLFMDNVTVDFSVAPNPVHDYVVVSVKNANMEMVVELLDNSGRVVRTQRLAAYEATLRLERGNLQNGIYMLRMTSNGQKQTRKVIFR